MANAKQLKILKGGVDAWHEWRASRLEEVAVDLSVAYLAGADLAGADLTYADLTSANLNDADLSFADLGSANLNNASLNGANLKKANLNGTRLEKSSFLKVQVGGTTFGNLDLSNAVHLDSVTHRGPSTVGADTIAKSGGKIPEVFLRGCGLSDADIEYSKLSNPDLNNEEINKILYKIYDLRASQAIQISPLFVAHSHDDSPFVDKIEKHLNNKGIRFWRDIHDMRAGRVEKQIDVAIRQNPNFLLVLSEHSLGSDWVQHEVRSARELEKELSRDVLCPVALDDSWKSSRWPKRIMDQIMEYNILDFSAWEDDSKFDSTFRKLIDGLKLFYKP